MVAAVHGVEDEDNGGEGLIAEMEVESLAQNQDPVVHLQGGQPEGPALVLELRRPQRFPEEQQVVGVRDLVLVLILEVRVVVRDEVESQLRLH